ncbi:hypothetical protein ACFVFI_01160 [Streptomyces sp. NPDC057705]|uniref:hypothetical protein n=1 Tax=Streptomyces sp. NPDC057705 TaxID=3346222 RepID=UPI00369A1A95
MPSSQAQNGRTTAYGWDAAGNLFSTTVPTTPAITTRRTQVGRRLGEVGILGRNERIGS